MKKGLLTLFFSLLIVLFSCETEDFIVLPTQSEIDGDNVDRDQTDDTSKTEIDVKGLNKSIVDGDTTPDNTDNTDYKKVNIDSSSVSHEFVINNTGSLDLKLTESDPYVVITPGTDTQSNDFILTTKPSNIIAPNGSSTFIIKFDPSTEGVKTATISIANNDADENPYNFTIKGEGTKTAVVLEPEIDITGLDKSIANGDVTPIDTDNTLYGKVNKDNGSISHEFSVKNIGDSDLELASNPDSLVVITPGANTNVNDFKITTKPSKTIATSGSSKFIIKFDPSSVGVKTAIISIASNDADENPYTFTVQGEGSEDPSQPAEIDITGSNQSILDGDSTPTASDNTDYGNLNVSSGSVSHEFIIKNTGEMDLELTGNDPYVIITPGTNTNSSDFIVTTKPVKTIAPSGSTKFIIKFDPSSQGVKTATVSIANNDADENPYNFTIQGEGATPEIDILGLDISITDGDDTPDSADNTQYGQTNIATGNTSHEFTIKNLGGADLKLTGANPYVTITPGTNTEASDFTLSSSPAGGITPNGSTTFIIKFNPSSIGIKTATISIANDDSDENPYNFTIEGEGFDDGSVDPNASCSFAASDITANSTITVDCLLDLKGQTINLPSNVNFDYAGGQIINGTLNFSGGYIEGDLLNYTLDVKGNARLKSPIFEFVPERWDIVQGTTTSTIATENNKKFEGLMFFIKKLEGTTFKTDKFDAYFEISKVTSTTTNQNFYPSVESVNIPSDFNLVMTNNTHLRVFPNNGKNGVLIAFREVSNSSISGGNLHGDRDEHIYENGANDTEGGNHVMMIHAANNIVVDGVNLTMGSKGGLNINALEFTFQPNYNPSHTITIRNCTFDRNRRMAVALTDGHNIVFENNTFIDTALSTQYSHGGVVGYAINLEGVRKRENGVLVYYERIYDVIIRNNTETGSRVGAFNVYSGENIIIEGNDFENKVTWTYASNSKVKNNRFTASAKSAQTPAIIAGGTGETVFNNNISNNVITGYGLGIAASFGEGLEIFDNKINECTTAIQLKKISNTKIYDNKITSSNSSSRGVMAHLTWADNVEITNNEIVVKSDPLYFVSFNQNAGEENYRTTIKNNYFESVKKLTFSKANGVFFENNTSETGIQMINTSNMDMISNTINTTNSDGIRLSGNSTSLTINSNAISIPINTRYECINNASTSSVNVNIGTNGCTEK